VIALREEDIIIYEISHHRMQNTVCYLDSIVVSLLAVYVLPKAYAL
jgi:hypothetical protein